MPHTGGAFDKVLRHSPVRQLTDLWRRSTVRTKRPRARGSLARGMRPRVVASGNRPCAGGRITPRLSTARSNLRAPSIALNATRGRHKVPCRSRIINNPTVVSRTPKRRSRPKLRLSRRVRGLVAGRFVVAYGLVVSVLALIFLFIVWFIDRISEDITCTLTAPQRARSSRRRQ
jgi:hypothetical protein